MNISEFVSKYLELKQQPKQKVNQQIKPEETFVNKHIKTRYVPYATKIDMSKSIIKFCMYKEINNKKVFVPNSPQRYCLFVQAIIDLYTDLEWDTTILDGEELRDISRDFDLLESNGLVEVLFSIIGEDISKFTTVLNMVLDDEVSTNHSVVSFLETKLETLSIMSNSIFDAFEDPVIKDNIVKYIQDKVISVNNKESEA